MAGRTTRPGRRSARSSSNVRKVARTAEGHMPAAFDPDGFGPEWSKQFTPRVVHGEDRVNLDKEMVKMAKNNLQYTALAQITKSSFEGIRNIITEGSK